MYRERKFSTPRNIFGTFVPSFAFYVLNFVVKLRQFLSSFDINVHLVPYWNRNSKLGTKGAFFPA